jgi:hypothetical protein
MLARVTDRLIAISPRIERELIADHHVGRPDQYRVIPLGFDLRRMTAIGDAERRAARRHAAHDAMRLSCALMRSRSAGAGAEP